jgi:tetratricopeptide (TPR) repeat protein
MSGEDLERGELGELQARWRSEPTPQLSLQLAEEYGRRGHPERAVETLERGLEAHPRHLSTRVALGRYRFELGRTRAAVEVLEEVVARDPTHLVANKLLAQAYSRLGEPAKARDRLDLYRLLNESDPEIGRLQQMVAGTVAAPIERTPPASPPAPVFREVAERRVEPAPEAPAARPTEEAPRLPLPAARPESGSSRREPFPNLWRGLDPARYLQELFASLFRGPAWAAARPRPSAPPEPEPAWSPESVEDSRPVAVVAPPVAAGGEEPDEEPLSAGPVAEEPEAGVTSLTLADLYLRQGHRSEAVRALKAVLARQPENAAAMERLSALVRSSDGELTAFDLLDGVDFAAAVGASERKARLLRSYLDRLSGGPGLDV